MKLGLFSIAIVALVPAMAAAQPLGWQERRVLRYEEPGHGYSARGSYEQLCMRWCPQDMVPCDPPHFKVADGRCSERRGNR